MHDAKNSILKSRSATRTLFGQVVVRKTELSEYIFQGAKKILVGVR